LLTTIATTSTATKTSRIKPSTTMASLFPCGTLYGQRRERGVFPIVACGLSRSIRVIGLAAGPIAMSACTPQQPNKCHLWLDFASG
jgi:hypothetical protein